MRNPRPAHFLAFYFCPLLLALALVAGFNAFVDPYRHFGPNPRMDEHRGASNTRTYKGELLAERGTRVAILGHSIAEIGLDPKHPAFRDRPAVNGAIMGGNLYEVENTVRVALQNPDLEEILLVTTQDQWGSAHNARHDFAKSRLDPARRLMEHRLEALFGLSSLQSAVNDFRRWQNDQTTIFHADGFRTMVDPAMVAKGSRHMFWFRAQQQLRGRKGSQGTPDPERVEMFRRMVRMCLDRDVRLTVAFPPQHAVSLETIFLREQFASFVGIRREALRVLEEEGADRRDMWSLWDFSGYHEYALEPVPPEGQKNPLMKWFWESDHIRKELGDLILDRIYGNAEGFGLKLTPDNIDAHLACIRAGHLTYVAKNPGEVEWLKGLLAEIEQSKQGDSTEK
jgi:hypothetical protein